MGKLEMSSEEAAKLLEVTPLCLRERIKAGYYPEWAKAVKPKGATKHSFIIIRAKFNAYWGVGTVKANTVEQFKIMQHIHDNFNLEAIEVELLERNRVRVTDATGDMAEFTYNNATKTVELCS